MSKCDDLPRNRLPWRTPQHDTLDRAPHPALRGVHRVRLGTDPATHAGDRHQGRPADRSRDGHGASNQVIVIEGERFKAVGANLPIPPGATVIDLSTLTVLPGLVDAHTHMGMTYKEQPENNYYYLTYIMDSTPLRAIQAASNGMQLLNSGFTVVRDVGNNALYVDAALRQAIEQGWLPGPTVIPSGPMIGSTGGQFWPTPEMYKQHNIMFPEYIDANSPDEIVRAVRENMLFGARTIKLCIDCKPWGYSVDDIKLAIREAATGGCKVEGPRADAGRRAAGDRRRHLHHRARQRADAGAPPADGREGDLPGRHGHAVHGLPRQRGGLQAGRRQSARRVGEEGAAHLLDRLRLLERADEGREDRPLADARRPDDRVPARPGRPPASRPPTRCAP